MEFNNEKELLEALQKDIFDITSNEVCNAVKELEKEVIEKEVLSIYKPSRYIRRNNNGINDIKNMQEKIISNNNIINLEITNETKGNKHDYRLDEVIEEGGDRYEYPYKNRDKDKYTYLNPRPFTEITQERINNGEIDNSFEEGLAKRGLIFEKE